MSNTQQPNNGLSIFKGILSRNSKDTVAIIKEQVEKGETDLAFLGVGLKKLHKIAELVKEDKALQTQIEDNLKLYQEGTKKTFSVHGAKITIANREYWDYSQTEDPMLEAMEKIEKEMKVMIKARKEELQAKAINNEKMNTPTGGVNFNVASFVVTFDKLPVLTWEDSVGEVNTNPPIKKGRESLRFSL